MSNCRIAAFSGLFLCLLAEPVLAVPPAPAVPSDTVQTPGTAPVPEVASSTDGSIDPGRAIQYAAQHNPTLAAALIDAEQAEQTWVAEDGRFVPVFQADASATHAETPRLQSSGATSTYKSDTFTLGSQLSHTFRWGTQVTARVQGSQTTTTSQLTGQGAATPTTPQVASTGTQLITLGPSYGLTGRLTLSQPLLRGAGRRVVEAAMRQARLSANASERSRDLAASSLLRDVLNAYWELWYQDRAVEIEERARALAVTQRNQAQQRADAGAIAAADVFSFETRVAQLDQSVATARAQRRKQSVEFSRQLGNTVLSPDLRTAPSTPPEALPGLLSRDTALADALANSREIAQAQAQVELARERATVAGETSRPRLDLVGYVQADGLSYREVPPAFERFATGQAVSANIGVTLELPVTSTTRTATRKAAELGAEAASARLRATRQQVEAQVATQFTQFEAARERVGLAGRTVQVATQQLAAQRERYARGAAIAFEVQQAEESLRQAELTAERARVDRTQAAIQLQHLTGSLLRQNAMAIPERRGPAARRVEGAARVFAGPSPSAF